VQFFSTKVFNVFLSIKQFLFTGKREEEDHWRRRERQTGIRK